MNNEAFRNLLANGHGAPPRDQPDQGRAPGSALGSRKSAFIPRHVRPTGTGPASTYVGKSLAAKGDAPPKKSRVSGPRGVKLGKGYQDRALERLAAAGNGEESEKSDERLERIAALDEALEAGEIGREEYERKRDEIAGGKVEDIHLVKGLDKRLLERVRRGEDVLAGGSAQTTAADSIPPVEVDDEFDELAAKDIQQVSRDHREKKGQAPSIPATAAGRKRTRDDILNELKAKRQAEQMAARPDLGDKFKSIEHRTEKPRVHIDSKGREVIITRDENGKIKKKVRKVNVEQQTTHKDEPAKAVRFLDAHVVVPARPESVPEADEDSEPEAMFDEVGSDYDPLAGMDGSDGDEDSVVDDQETNEEIRPQKKADADAEPSQKPLTSERPSAKPRNYFATTSSSGDADPASNPTAPINPFQDQAFLSAISRASDLHKFKMNLSGPALEAANEDPAETDESRIQRLEEEARLKKKRDDMLLASARDMDDMDLGFGGGRFDEDDEGDGERIKLSEWRGGGDDDDDEGDKKDRGAKKKRVRNRGGKVGDKNSAKDVLDVLARRTQ